MKSKQQKLKPVLCGIALATVLSYGVPSMALAEEKQSVAQDSQTPIAEVPVIEVEVKDKKIVAKKVTEIEATIVREGGVDNGYRYQVGNVGPLGKMSLQDTPFSIHVTSGELIENRNAHTVSEALKTNPTVATLMESNTSSSMSRVMIRGFTAADQSDLRDGLVDRSFAFVPLENVERIEVINGLSGFLYGFSAVGGTVNYVSKPPVAKPLFDITTGIYGGGINFLHADLGGPINERLTYRLNAYKEDGSGYIKGSTQSRDLLSGAIKYQLSSATTLTADYYHQNLSMTGLATYIPLVNGKVPSANLFNAAKQYSQSWTHNDAEKTLMGIGLETKLSDTVKFRGGYRYGDMWRNYDYVSMINLQPNGSYTQKYIDSPTQYETTHSAYALFDVGLQTGSIHHDVTFGYTGTSMGWYRGDDQSVTLGTSYLDSASYFTRPGLTDSFTNGGGNSPANYFYDSFLLGDKLTFNQSWSALVGVNHARYRFEKFNPVTFQLDSSKTYTTSKNTPSIALVFKPRPNISTYVSYMQGLEGGGYVTTTGANNIGALLPSYVSDQWETGVKATLGKVDVTAALFRISKANGYLDTDNYYKQDGREVHQGLEVTAVGKLNDQVTLGGGFTLMNARIVSNKQSPAQDGKIPINVPEQMARVYIEYAVPKVTGLTAVAGANYFGKRPVDTAATQNFLAGATTFDAGLRYQTKSKGYKTTYSLNVSNVFNKSYWSYYRSGDGLLMGAPRMISMSVKIEF